MRYRSCQLGGVGRLLSRELAVAQHRKQPAGQERSTPAPVGVGVGRRVPLAKGPSLQPPFWTESLSRRQPRPMASCLPAGPLWPSCSRALPVLEEGRAVFEGATALGALVGPLLGAAALVAAAGGPGGVGPRAQATRVGALAAVGLQVLAQPRAGRVGLLHAPQPWGLCPACTLRRRTKLRLYLKSFPHCRRSRGPSRGRTFRGRVRVDRTLKAFPRSPQPQP